MPPTMSKSRSRHSPGVVMPSQPSIFFQEALRLCHKEKDEDSWAEEDETPSLDETSRSNSSVGDSSRKSAVSGNKDSSDLTVDAMPPTPLRTRRAFSVSSSPPGHQSHKLHPDSPLYSSSDSVARSPQRRTSQPEPAKGFVPKDDAFPSSASASVAATGEARWPSRRRLSLPLTRKSELMRVQWADELEQELVRENPRKRYERKPSVQQSDHPRPILKNGSPSSGSLNEKPDQSSSS